MVEFLDSGQRFLRALLKLKTSSPLASLSHWLSQCKKKTEIYCQSLFYLFTNPQVYHQLKLVFKDNFYFMPLLEAEFQISSASLYTTSLPSSVSCRRQMLQQLLEELVCHLGVSPLLYMTRLQSACMHRRMASELSVSEDQTGFQP